ncbi:MAG: phosphoglycerate dehydrogenase, partial [Aeromicrobium sp.]
MTQLAPFPTAPISDSDLKILLLENIHAEGADFLRSKGYQVEALHGALAEDELIEKIKGVHVLGIRSTTYITEKVLAA